MPEGTSLEHIRIAFSSESLFLLNFLLGFIMFGVALGIDTKDFDQLKKNPRAVLAGVLSQFILLPALTFALVLIFKPEPALALGMMLVASCPGGNISNFISSISGGNVSLSVSLTALATILSPVFTPLNFELWSGAYEGTSSFLGRFELSFMEMLKTVLILLVVPLFIGIYFRKKLPKITALIEKPIRILSILVLMGFIGVALFNNREAFEKYLQLVFFLVLVHNIVALTSGYFSGYMFRLKANLKRTITIETGIQNSGLGLIIIFNFFDGDGGMALIAAWWGIWHIIAGLLLAFFLRRRDRSVRIRSLS